MAKVEIYTRDYCGYCANALRLLASKGVAVSEYNASRDPRLRSEMIARSRRNTFPQIFINDRHIGGSDELTAFDRAGKLDKALRGGAAGDPPQRSAGAGSGDSGGGRA